GPIGPSANIAGASRLPVCPSAVTDTADTGAYPQTQGVARDEHARGNRIRGRDDGIRDAYGAVPYAAAVPDRDGGFRGRRSRPEGQDEARPGREPHRRGRGRRRLLGDA